MHFQKILLPILLGSIFMGIVSIGEIAIFPQEGLAAVFDGGGAQTGIGQAAGISGLAKGEPRSVIERALRVVINFVALMAVIAIVVAGLFLILGMGDETSKDRAQKIVLYTIIGLLVLLFVRVIVGFITRGLF